MKIRMLETVVPEFAFLCKRDTFLIQGKEYEAYVANTHGAVVAICDNGEKLGVKPSEYVTIP